ncbi:ATP-binding protein [bacterium]|nr:ATP-binding protein [bacterium]
MDQWTEILKRGYESKELDYKAPCAWNSKNKKASCELVKDILAIANTSGGWLVIGVSETDTGWNWEGLNPVQVASFATTPINQFIQRYADPPINTTIHIVEDEGKTFVIISVPKFPDTPHICQKDFPDVLHTTALYVRTDNNESAPLKSSSDMRSIVETAIRNRSDTMLTSIRSILVHGVSEEKPDDEIRFQKQIKEISNHCDELNPHRDKGYAYLETIIYPSEYRDDRFEVDELRLMAENASVDYTGWPFIFISKSRPDYTYNINNGIETSITDPDVLSQRDDLHFWQLKTSGLFYMKELLREDKRSLPFDEGRVVAYEIFSMTAGKIVDCLVKLYEGKIDDEQGIHLCYTLNAMKERSLVAVETQRSLRRGYICKVDEISKAVVKPYSEWKSGLMDSALEICNHVFKLFNWQEPNLHESRNMIENMFKRIYP